MHLAYTIFAFLHSLDPLLPVEPSDTRRQVSDCSGHPARLLIGSASATGECRH